MVCHYFDYHHCLRNFLQEKKSSQSSINIQLQNLVPWDTVKTGEGLSSLELKVTLLKMEKLMIRMVSIYR